MRLGYAVVLLALLPLPFVAPTPSESTDLHLHVGKHQQPPPIVTASTSVDFSNSPVIVDGSRTPDLIPDALAYRHFLISLALSDTGAAQREIDRRDATLAQMALSAPDVASVVAALRGLKSDLDAVSDEIQQRVQSTLASETELSALSGQQDTLIENAKVRLRGRLTADGWVQFDNFVHERVKRQIVIYGDH